MIVLTLGGGLGNQMFQYAFARKLQKESKDNKLKFSGYHLVGTGNSEKMLFNLNIVDGVEFCSEDEQTVLERFQEKKLNVLRYYKKLNRIIKGIAPWKVKQMTKKGFFTTNTIYDYADYYVTDVPVKYVEGGFQTWKYWQDMMPEICDELKVKKAPSQENAAIMEEMQNCESVCVHIRRGDYLAPQFAHLNVCDEKYYLTAMDKMVKQKPNAVFYIFTNNHEEVEWIKANYPFPDYQVRYVDLNNPDYEELRLMYHCKNFIISNSTYSWWAQLLSDNADKIVMAPSVWNREMNADNIYMPEWQIIDVE